MIAAATLLIVAACDMDERLKGGVMCRITLTCGKLKTLSRMLPTPHNVQLVDKVHKYSGMSCFRYSEWKLTDVFNLKVIFHFGKFSTTYCRLEKSNTSLLGCSLICNRNIDEY